MWWVDEMGGMIVRSAVVTILRRGILVLGWCGDGLFGREEDEGIGFC